MIIVADKSKKIRAYIYNNIILVPGTMEVLGVILGNCVFGKDGKVKGKYFNKKLYSINGEIIATDNGSFNDRTLDLPVILNEGWRLITTITDHICPWVTPLEKWSNEEVLQVLRGISMADTTLNHTDNHG